MEKNKQIDAEVSETALLLWKVARRIGIIDALDKVFEYNIEVSLPLQTEFLDTDISNFDLGTRVNNIMSKWCKLHADQPRTVRRIVSLIEMGDRAKEFVTGYGKSSQNMLKTFMLEECYRRMSQDDQKLFCLDIIQKNCRYEEAPHA